MKKPRTFLLPILALLISLLPAAQSTARGDEVPYVPTPEIVVEAMLTLGEVAASDNLVDLGSGDGRIVVAAAKQRRARALGIEFNPDLVAQSREAAAREGVADRATFLQQDIFLSDFRSATVVTMYLLPEVNLKLRPRILELRPGTRIVSHDFDMGDWDADEQRWIDVPEKTVSYDRRSILYLWIVPADISGRWSGTITGPDGEEPIVLEFDQKFQKAAVKAESPRGNLAGNCRLRGETLALRFDRAAQKTGSIPARFELQVRENEMRGEGNDGKRRFLLRAKRM